MQTTEPSLVRDSLSRFFTINPRYNLFSREYWFGQVDTRPLSVFRIFFGLILIKDALFHLALAPWFYSDTGIVPRSALTTMMRTYRFSLMDSLRFTWMADIFFLLWAVVIICFILGWRTRLMTVLNFIMLISIHERNIYVLNGADTVMRVVCFWMMFLPLGHYYSIDAMKGRFARYLRTRDLADLRADSGPRTTYAFPLRMLQIQFALIYLFTSILKLPGFAWANGTAIYYAMQLKSLTLPTGDLLLNAPLPILQFMSYQSLVTELVFFWFVLSPFGQPYLRMVGLLLGTMLHAGIAATMAIGNFSAVMITTYLIFLEPEWITWVGSKLRATIEPSVLPVPAGPSPLWFLLAATTQREIAVDPEHMLMQSDPDGWWMIDEQGNRLEGRSAWGRAIGHLPVSKLYAWILPTLRAPIWRALCSILMRDVPPRPSLASDPLPDAPPPVPLLPARVRSVVGVGVGLLTGWLLFWAITVSRSSPVTEWSPRNTAWAVIFSLIPAIMAGWGAASAYSWLGPDSSARATWRSMLTAALSLLLTTIIWWNVTTIKCAEDAPLWVAIEQRLNSNPCVSGTLIDSVPEVPRRTVQQLSLWQAWDMFSPYPSTLDGWIVIPGVFEDGTTFDLNTGEPLSTEFHRWFYGPGMRWKKYESNVSRDEPENLLRAWGSYWCGYYNDELELPRGQRLATLEIRFYQYKSHSPTEPPNPREDIELWRHWCYPEYEY